MALGGGTGGGGNARGIEAGRAFVRLGAKDDLTGVLKRVGGRFAEFGKMALAATGVGGLIGGAAGGFGFKETADDMAKMLDVAKAFGITGKQASGLFGLLGAAGGEFKENLEGVIQFSNTLQEAVDGVGTQGAKLFDGLSVSAKELVGIPVDEQFYKVHEAIRELPQGMQEAKLALLGGTDSMKQWQKLLAMSSEEARQIAKDMAISNAELEDAAAASKAMQQAGAAANRVWQQFVIMIAPLVTQTATAITSAMKGAVEWLKGRTLQDLWDEAVAHLALGWERIKQVGRETWAAVAGFFTDAWYDAEAQGKLIWIGLFEWIDKLMSKEFWQGLLDGFVVQMKAVETLFGNMLTGMAVKTAELFTQVMNVVTNPAAAAAALAALANGAFAPAKQEAAAIEQAVKQAEADVKAMHDAGVNKAADTAVGGRDKVLLEAAQKKLDAANERAKWVAEGQEGVARAEAELARVQAEIDGRRRRRQNDDLMDMVVKPGLQQKLDRIASTLGTFGAVGGLLNQAFGVQGSDNPAKEMVKQQKKGNVLLKDVVKAVQDSVPRFL